MKKIYPELTYLSAFAILMVVAIHSSSPFLIDTLGFNSYSKSIPLFITDQFVHSAVPLFFFISGFKYTEINTLKEYSEFITKKIKTTIIPFLIVSIFVTFVFFIAYKQSIDVLFINILKIFLGDNYAYQLWYIPVFWLVSVCYPLLHYFFKNDKSRMVFLVLTQIVTIIFLRFNKDLITATLISSLTYLLYFDLGFLIKNNYEKKINTKRLIIIYIFLFVLSIFIRNNELLLNIYNFSLLYPLQIIILYYYSKTINKNKGLKYLGENSFEIFILHAQFATLLIYKILSRLDCFNHYYDIFILFISSVILSVIEIELIKKIKFDKILFYKLK